MQCMIGFALLVVLVIYMIYQRRKKNYYEGEINRLEAQLEEQQKYLQDIMRKFWVAHEWLGLYDKSGTILGQCRKLKISQIVVYGVTELAVHFICACQKEGINIVAITDRRIKREGGEYQGIPLKPPSVIYAMKMEDTMIVVTSVAACGEIMDELYNKGICNAVSLQELINGI